MCVWVCVYMVEGRVSLMFEADFAWGDDVYANALGEQETNKTFSCSSTGLKNASDVLRQ